MSVNLREKIGRGLTPQQFMDGMTKNKEKFMEYYERFSWSDENNRRFFQSLKSRGDLRCLIVAADWCGDVVRNVPVVFRVLEEAGMPVEVLIMEEHTDVIDRFLTLGGRSIPKVIFTDSAGNVLGDWGPRPERVQEAMVRFKEKYPDREHPDYQEQLKATYQEIQKRYGEGTAYHAEIEQELKRLLSSFVQ